MKKLNFGAGQDIKEDYDNVDFKDFDFNIFPYPISDNTYDYIYCRHVLEHLDNPERVLNELCRISKPNGVIEIIVPHVNCEGAFADLGHKRFFAEGSFNAYANPPTWRKNPYKVEIISMTSIPSHLGDWIYGNWIKRKLSLLLRGIYSQLKVELKVIKDERK